MRDLAAGLSAEKTEDDSRIVIKNESKRIRILVVVLITSSLKILYFLSLW